MNKRTAKSAGGTFSSGILLILGIFLPVILIVSLGISLSAGFSLTSFEDLKISDYFQSATFSSALFQDANSLLSSISAQETLDSLDSDACIDLQEIYTGQTLSYKNTSGLAYSFDDLLKWSERDSTSSDDWMVLTLTTPDGDPQYMYYSDFAKAVKNGELNLNATSGSLEAENISQSDWNKRILNSLKSQQYMLEKITDHEPLKNITDKNGKTLYTNVLSNYSAIPCMEMLYAPTGYKSLLDYMNSTTPEERGFTGSLEDAYTSLSRAIQQASDLSSQARSLKTYTNAYSNISYCYINRKTGNLYSNSGNDYKNISDKYPYVSVSPDLNESFTNLNTDGPVSLGSWISEVQSYIGDSDFAFHLWIKDTTLPAGDQLQASARNYKIYRKIFVPAACISVFSVLLLLFVLIQLTVKAGHPSGSSDKKICLNSFDRIYTEIAAAIVCIPALMIFIFNLSVAIESYLPFLLISIFSLLLISCLFWIGYLSLVRRIKAGTLWKNSFLCKLLGKIHLCLAKSSRLVEFYSRNVASRIRMTLVLAAFLIGQFLISLLCFICLYNQFTLGAIIWFLVLLAADLWAFYRIYRIATGRETLLTGLRKITDGDLSFKIPEDTLKGGQKLMAEYINRIGEGLDAAVDKSIRDERMKAELITNVSHDLKTPLTSIINYIDLLKRKNFTDPEVLNYLQILESKSQRLKSLTEDVVEASKASTGNLSLEMADLDFVEMLYQVMGEFEERMAAAHLTLMTHIPDSPAVIVADGRRMWRILENLFGNVLKYALENTRVYAEVLVDDKEVTFTLKNISRQPLNIPAEELTERFIRGDVSRNTEGSGLGLSIAQSLTQLQGGTFRLYLDGDLFKAILKFPRKK